jgi:hypothetical protein
MMRLFSVLGVFVLIVSATAERAYGAPVDQTCAALRSFVDDGGITDATARLAAGRADLRQAGRAANASGDRKLATLTRRFRAAFDPAVKHPNKASAQTALNKAGTALWSYCSKNGFVIGHSTATTSPPASG